MYPFATVGTAKDGFVKVLEFVVQLELLHQIQPRLLAL